MNLTSEPPTHTTPPKRAPNTRATVVATDNVPTRPTTFFVCSERDLANHSTTNSSNNTSSPPSRPRKASQDLTRTSTQADTIAVHERSWTDEEMTDESTFGVQSLDETVASEQSIAGLPHNSIRHNNHERSDAALDNTNRLGERKHKIGNPVHPKIVAAGQRILSTEQRLWTTSPVLPVGESFASRTNQRRFSGTSSVCLSQPLTPLRISSNVGSTSPSTARSASPKSFRLSDEEASVVSESGSHVVASSRCGEERGGDVTRSRETSDSSMPQLVMPSLALPTRRPFTDRGRRMGKLRMMLVGARGVGKTSLVHSISRVCNDIVHLDPIDAGPTETIREIGASSRPYPSWWRDSESSRKLSRQKTPGESVLERNITFIDTPGLDTPQGIARIRSYVDMALESTAQLRSMNDSDIVGMLSGDGGGMNIDAVLYLIDATIANTAVEDPIRLGSDEQDLLAYLCRWSNVIPILSRCDRIDPEQVSERTEHLSQLFQRLGLELYPDCGPRVPVGESDSGPAPFFATSSALGDDSETIDASLLMASEYLPPFVPSQLDEFVHELLEPNNLARLRHLAAIKFVSWLRQRSDSIHDLRSQDIQRMPQALRTSDGAISTTTGGQLDDLSKVMIPHKSSGCSRVESPETRSMVSVDISSSEDATPGNLLATAEPGFRQMRLARWARDLQHSLYLERQRYQAWYRQSSSSPPPSPSSLSRVPDTSHLALDLSASPNAGPLSLHRSATPLPVMRPAKGHLGGALSIVDPRDPLGLLSLQRRGWSILRLVGAGAALFWLVRGMWLANRDHSQWPPGWPWTYDSNVSRTPMRVMGVPAPAPHSTVSIWSVGSVLEDAHVWLTGLWSKMFGLE